MTKKKRIQRLEARVDALEKSLNSLISTQPITNSQESKPLSFEEVIDVWLNGKKA